MLGSTSLLLLIVYSLSGAALSAATTTTTTVASTTTTLAPAPNERQIKQLAIFFENVPSNKSDYHNLTKEYQYRISSVFKKQPEDVIFQSIRFMNNGSVFPFQLRGESAVIDSSKSPQPFNATLSLWKESIVSNKDIRAPYHFDGIDVKVSSTLSDYVTDFNVVEGVDPEIAAESGTSAKDQLIQAIKGRSELLQLRLTNTSAEMLAKPDVKYFSFIKRIRQATASVLNVEEDAIIIESLSEDPIVLRFTVYPASDRDLKSYSELWSKAIQSKDSKISSVFEDIDDQFPATYVTGVTTTTTPTPTITTTLTEEEEDTTTAIPSTQGKKGSHAGLVAGAILGSLAGVAVIGGAAAGYSYRKKQKDSIPSVRERRPEAVNDSPHRLSNINIHGEATPNPHNY